MYADDIVITMREGNPEKWHIHPYIFKKEMYGCEIAEEGMLLISVWEEDLWS